MKLPAPESRLLELGTSLACRNRSSLGYIYGRIWDIPWHSNFLLGNPFSVIVSILIERPKAVEGRPSQIKTEKKMTDVAYDVCGVNGIEETTTGKTTSEKNEISEGIGEKDKFFHTILNLKSKVAVGENIYQ